MPSILIEHKNMASVADWIHENRELAEGAVVVLEGYTVEELCNWFEIEDTFKSVRIEKVVGTKILASLPSTTTTTTVTCHSSKT